jgi:hypothetical protein
MQKIDHDIGFKEKRQFFAKNREKIAVPKLRL